MLLKLSSLSPPPIEDCIQRDWRAIKGMRNVGYMSREMVKWRRYINHNKQKQLWDLTFVTVYVDNGVEKSNAASLRVLEKVGFVWVAEERVKDWYGGPM
jgi:hypothetical protein